MCTYCFLFIFILSFSLCILTLYDDLIYLVPIYGGLGDGCIFAYNDSLYDKIIERAKRQRMMLNPSTT